MYTGYESYILFLFMCVIISIIPEHCRYSRWVTKKGRLE